MASQAVLTHPTGDDVRIEVVSKPEEVVAGFDCICDAFGNQARDAIWMATNPEWNKSGPEGRPQAAARMVKEWQSITYDNKGRPNKIFLVATVPSEGKRVVAGMAVWAQLSMVEGHGDQPSNDLRSSLDLEALYPGNESEQRFLCQVWRSFTTRRVEVAKEKQSSEQPSIFHLSICGVHSAYQRRGIAGKLVQWGLDEAQRRGGLEAITEASSSKYHQSFGLRLQRGPPFPSWLNYSSTQLLPRPTKLTITNSYCYSG